ncbi:MAG: hypothetical protein ABIA63_06785 [bacterium]
MTTPAHKKEQPLPLIVRYIIIAMFFFELMAFISALDMLEQQMVNVYYCRFIWLFNLCDIFINIAIFIYLFNRVRAALRYLFFMAGFDMIMPFIVYFLEEKTGWGFKYSLESDLGSEITGFLITVGINGFLIYYFSKKEVQKDFY